jgi:hypothetical protein
VGRRVIRTEAPQNTSYPAMRLTTVLSLALMTTQMGCWVRTPTIAPEAIRSKVGSVATVKQDLFLCDMFDSYTAKPYSIDDPNRKYIAKLPRGSKIKVEGIVSRRLPPGIYYYFVCRSDAVPQKFDVQAKDYGEEGNGDFLYLDFSP